MTGGGGFVLAAPREALLAGLVAAAAWLLVAALEWRRARRGGGGSPARRGVRLGLVALALLAAVALQARPASLQAPQPATVVLATPGATAAEVAAATAAVAADAAWAVPGRAGEPRAAGAPPLADAGTLGRRQPGLERIRVVGHGLTAAEWEELPGLVEAAPAPPLPFGVRAISWDRQVALGEVLEVRGEVASAPPEGAELTLRGAGGEARAKVAGGGGPFVLRVVPRAAGRHRLTLRVGAASGAVEETLGVDVRAASPPAVLWLEDAPTLESRELAQWLAPRGGAVAVRSRVSRTAWRETRAGLPGDLALAVLTPELLARFDLVVLDGGALEGLRGSERAALAAAVRDGGLGVLLRPEAAAAGPVAPLGVGFTLRRVPDAAELAARLAWGDGGEAPELALPPRELAGSPELVPLAADRAGRLLAAWRPLGAGRVGVALVDGTWRWVREGSPAAHRRYWQEALRALGRPAAAGPRWTAPAGPLRVGAPVALSVGPAAEPPPARVRQLDAGGAAPPGSLTAPEPLGDVPLALRQGAGEPTRWAATWWPRSPGWHQVGEGDGALALWVDPADRWVPLRLAERRAATADRVAGAAGAPGAARSDRALPAPLPVPWPRWPWFALFVAAAAALWAEDLWRRRTAASGAPAAPARAA